MINLTDAKRNLSKEDYEYVLALYYVYINKNQQIRLNYSKYLRVCDGIIADFDLIAPYYKFCGDVLLAAKIIDDEKITYRRKAKRLIENNSFGTLEWNSLKEKFMKEFYHDFDMNILK